MPASMNSWRASATAGPPTQALISGSGRLPGGWMAGSMARAMSVEGTMAVGAWMNSSVPVSCGCLASAFSAST